MPKTWYKYEAAGACVWRAAASIGESETTKMMDKSNKIEVVPGLGFPNVFIPPC